MRHIAIAATMLFIAIGVTFGTATLLEVRAVASARQATDTVIVQAARPALKPVGKERTLSMREGVIRAASNDVTSLR